LKEKARRRGGGLSAACPSLAEPPWSMLPEEGEVDEGKQTKIDVQREHRFFKRRRCASFT